MATRTGWTNNTTTVRRLRDNLRSRRLPCHACGMPIDYGAHPDDPNSFTVDHIKPQSLHPDLALDPGNLAPLHKKCNSVKGVRDERPAIGLTTSGW